METSKHYLNGFLLLLLHCVACRVLVPWPEIETELPAWEAHSLF